MRTKKRMGNLLIKEMLAQAARDKDESALAFFTQLCLDSNIKIETINEWIEQDFETESRPLG